MEVFMKSRSGSDISSLQNLGLIILFGIISIPEVSLGWSSEKMLCRSFKFIVLKVNKSSSPGSLWSGISEAVSLSHISLLLDTGLLDTFNCSNN
jgi:hypothetical protein